MPKKKRENVKPEGEFEQSAEQRDVDGERVQKSGHKEHEYMQWPMRVELNVQGFHVSVRE